MGKKRHSKDPGYVTKTEWQTQYGGYKQASSVVFKQLPYYCCALTFTPFSDPVVTDDGYCFEILHIIPYIQKFKKHPVTGEPLSVAQLTKLTFHKNAEDQFCCPVLGKVFTDSTHIVANKKSGNVYCYQAVDELNIKTKCWKDLLTDEAFTRKDLVTIQDPNDLSARETSKFQHVEKNLTVDLGAEGGDPGTAVNVSAQSDTARALASLGTSESKELFEKGGGGKKAEAERMIARAKQAEAAKNATPKESTRELPASIVPTLEKHGVAFRPGAHTWNTDDQSAAPIAPKSKKPPSGKPPSEKASKKEGSSTSDPFGLAPSLATQGIYVQRSKMQTTGACSRSLTSSVYTPTTTNELAYVQVEKNPKKKGYVALHTNFGDLNIELHCDITPRTCENFIGLCETGYYDNVIFHRNIKNFMIQGGDPTGTGTGGESIWKRPFKDELNSKLTHHERGVLSMANSGPGTNKSQFFILYKSAPHLDYKHTVFGKLVGGKDVLSKLESVPVDNDDRPKEVIKITRVSIFVNPYAEMDGTEEAEAEDEEEVIDEEAEKVGSWYSNPSSNELTQHRSGIGKYLKPADSLAPSARASKEAPAQPPAAKKPKLSSASYGNFDAW